ncbi:MAG: hypothetical protein JSV85_06510 [Candidatus Bathyarchaeota archaeon]|nr:MAG: hypothetical protein JSV85_06510 [Candidatus Bathyarchaeota archaeon]
MTTTKWSLDLRMACHQLTAYTRRLAKTAVALGGFLIMVGMLLIGVALLFGLFGTATGSEFRTLFLWALLVISVCDIIAGVILLFR